MSNIETLAISSLSGARTGVNGVVTIAFFGIGMVLIINLIGRREYRPEGFEMYGTIAISFISYIIGSYIGYGTGKQLSPLVYAIIFCAIASFYTSGKLLGFRLPHRTILGFTTPVIFILSSMAGKAIHLYLSENIL